MAILSASVLKANTVHTKTGIDALMKELRLVREQGYAIIDQELEIGLRSIAIPLFNTKGKTVAALNIGAQAARTSVDDLVVNYLPVMRETQQAISHVLM